MSEIVVAYTSIPLKTEFQAFTEAFIRAWIFPG